MSSLRGLSLQDEYLIYLGHLMSFWSKSSSFTHNKLEAENAKVSTRFALSRILAGID